MNDEDETKDKPDFARILADEYGENIDLYKEAIIEIKNCFNDEHFYQGIFLLGKLYQKMNCYQEEL